MIRSSYSISELRLAPPSIGTKDRNFCFCLDDFIIYYDLDENIQASIHLCFFKSFGDQCFIVAVTLPSRHRENRPPYFKLLTMYAPFYEFNEFAQSCGLDNLPPPREYRLAPSRFLADVAEPTFAEVFYDYEGWSKGCGVVEFRTGPLQQGVEGPSDSGLGTKKFLC